MSTQANANITDSEMPPPTGHIAPLRVSVVIPAFNAEATLGETLAALAEQRADHGRFEVLVADNRSTDRTAAVAHQWASRLPLRVIDASARKGQAAAMNIAAAAVSGRLLVFTDADDVPLPGWLDAWLSVGDDVGFASGPVVWFDDGDATPTHPMVVSDRPPTHMGAPYALGTNLAVARRFLDACGGLDESIPPAQDVELSFRLLDRGIELSFVRDAIVAKRTRSGTLQVVRQYFAYGLCDPELYRRYGRVLVRRPDGREIVRTYLGLFARSVFVWNPRSRTLWARQVGRRAGRLVGSVRARTFYP
jgi:glycosyltransferase involved in cell wall biosynthesis